MTEGAGPYRVMPRPVLTEGRLTVRAVDPGDIESIRLWRNAQLDVLRQARPITAEEQRAYYARTIWPDKASPTPSTILLAIIEDGRLVGYGGLVHVNWDYRRAEVSFLLDPEIIRDAAEIAALFASWLFLMRRLAFDDLGLLRLTTETYAFRELHLRVLDASGFVREGRLRRHARVGEDLVDAVVHGCLAADEERQRTLAEPLGAVLVTSASRKAPLVRALQDAARRIDPTARVIAGDLDPEAATRHVADAFWAMPRVADEIVADLVAGCVARGVQVVLPTRDGELDFWSRHAARFAAAGIEVVVSSPEAIARCRDKLAFAAWGVDRGLPVIAAAGTPDAFAADRLVVKERFGAGSRGIGLDLAPDAARAHAARLTEPIFQPFVAGREISVDAWMTRAGAVHGLVLRWRDRVIGGESEVTTTFRDPTLEAQAAAVLSALGLRGPAVMQAIVTEAGLATIEVNPRFGGASTCSIAAGLDTLRWSLLDARAPGAPLPAFVRRAGEVRQVRVPADILVHDPRPE